MKIKKINFFIAMLMLSAIASINHAATLPASALVNATFVSQTPDPAEPNSIVELRFRVRNIGTEVIKDVVLELVPSYPFSLVEDGIKEIGTLYGRDNVKDSYLVVYKVKVDKDAVEGEHDIKLRYKNKGYWTEFNQFKVRIKTHDILLALKEVKTEPKKASPGQEVDLKITLHNLADSVIRNIKIELGLLRITTITTGFGTLELPFTPIGSSNEQILEQLDAGAETTVNFRLLADGDAEARNYKVPLSIIFSDDLGRNFSKSNIIGIIVDEAPEIYAAIENSEVIMAGKAGEVSIKFTNKGATDLKYLDVSLEETNEFNILSPKKVYLGNVDSDDYETAEFRLYVNKDANKEVKLPVRMEFRDNNNQRYTQEAELKLGLYSKEEAKRYGLIEKSNSTGIVISIIIIVVGVILYRRWRKKSKR